MAGSLRVRGRENSHMVRETGLCGGGTELKTLESEEGNLGEGPQRLLLPGAPSVDALPSP